MNIDCLKKYIPCFVCGKLIVDYKAKIAIFDGNAEFVCNKHYNEFRQNKEVGEINGKTK